MKKETALEDGETMDDLWAEDDDEGSKHSVSDVLHAVEQGVLSVDEAADILE